MRTLASLTALALLAGCATPAYVSPVEVTRFSAAQLQPLGRGPIAVRTASGGQTGSWELAAFQSAVASELQELGYTVTDNAAQVAEIRVERFVARNEAGRRSPVSVGVGGSTGSYGSGVGVGLGINLGNLVGGRPAEQIDTQLQVMIRPSAGGDALWEGRARFTATANSRFGDQRAAAGKLADALFDGFPGRSGETIEVR